MQHASNLQPRLFADDTNIFTADSSIDHLEQNTNHELLYLDIWLKSNYCKLSLDKTTYCIYSPKKKLLTYDCEVRIGDVIKKFDSVT